MISPLIAWIKLSDQEPYGRVSRCGLLRLLAIIFTLTLATPTTVPVAIAKLFPVVVSLSLVVMFTLLAKDHPEVYMASSVPVTTKLPPLPAGKVPIANVVVGIVIPVGTISVMTTLAAVFPPLFPYVIV